ncbi:MAG TPA: FAD-binding oxidoreductase [Solirubrobacteraceae bacterium]|jgi:decaprenylphospho-beta-D-ribofuranose 2-oxidase|nr:FAD-binding oxidoreductase [Solirubrobacteraceae bacterium]
MSVRELSAPAAQSQLRSVSGWGRTSRSSCHVIQPRALEHVLEALANPRGGVIARGAGRSYGDAAQNGGGTVLDMTALDRVISIDPESRLVTAQAGATIARLMSSLAAHGLALPVLPGTRHVTLAGAIASDVHGKNHHRDGAFARHVTSLTLCTPADGLVRVTPESDPELFGATLGGMGLTGVLVEATVRAEPLPSAWVSADTDRTDGLEQTLALMSGEESHRYSVAWLDLLAAGASMGRAVVVCADPLPADQRTPAARTRRGAGVAYPGTLSRRPTVEVPRGFPGALLRPSSVRAFNALHWWAAPRRERERPLALAPYFFPLDAVGAWNRLYGAGGLVQYQFVIPRGAEDALVRCFELIRERRLPVYLAVFKRMGAASGGPLSFPLEGWTLAVDIPAAAPGLRAALEALDQLVAGAGGRVYLSKDARLGRDALAAMYPQLDRFHAQRARVDPQRVLRSDLAQRLGLCGATA